MEPRFRIHNHELIMKDSIVIDWEFLELIQHLSTKRLRSLRNEERNQFEFREVEIKRIEK